MPSLLSVKVTPAGRTPISLNAGVGTPALVTRNAPGSPTVKVALPELVMAGGPSDDESEGLGGLGQRPVGRRHGDRV